MKKMFAIVIASMMLILTISTALAATGYTSGGAVCTYSFSYSDSDSAGKDWVSGNVNCNEDSSNWVYVEIFYKNSSGDKGSRTATDSGSGTTNATASITAASGCDGYKGTASYVVNTDSYGGWTGSRSATW